MRCLSLYGDLLNQCLILKDQGLGLILSGDRHLSNVRLTQKMVFPQQRTFAIFKRLVESDVSDSLSATTSIGVKDMPCEGVDDANFVSHLLPNVKDEPRRERARLVPQVDRRSVASFRLTF